MNRRLLIAVTAAAVMLYSPPPWRPDIITPYPQAPSAVTPYVPPKPKYPWWIRMWTKAPQPSDASPFAGMWDVPLHATTR